MHRERHAWTQMILGPGGQLALCVCACARALGGVAMNENLFFHPSSGNACQTTCVSVSVSVSVSVCRSVSFPSLVSLQSSAAAEHIGERKKSLLIMFLHHFQNLNVVWTPGRMRAHARNAIKLRFSTFLNCGKFQYFSWRLFQGSHSVMRSPAKKKKN